MLGGYATQKSAVAAMKKLEAENEKKECSHHYDYFLVEEVQISPTTNNTQEEK